MHEKVVLTGSWQNLVHEPARSALAGHLWRFAREQRWYRSKAAPLESFEIEQVFLFGADSASDHCLTLLGVALEGGLRETYVMPLRFVAAGAAMPDAPALLVAEIEIRAFGDIPPKYGVLLDATASGSFAQTLLALLRERRVLRSESGTIGGESFCDLGATGDSLEPRFLTLEQSNSTILYGSAWLLKLLRKLEPGPNVELEIGRFLANASPIAQVPRTVGSLQLNNESFACTLAIVSEYVDNRGSAWSWTLQELSAFFERIATDEAIPIAVALPSAPPAECTDAIPEGLLRLAGPYFSLLNGLAERTAELHRALGSDTREPGFGQEPFTKSYQEKLYQGAHAQLVRSFIALRGSVRALPDDAALLARVFGAEAALDDSLRRITRSEVLVTRIRCHGDYHLGQVLFTGNDFTIIDFEGEPGRPLAERRDKGSPLRDLAGMLRSFAYATETALRSERVRDEDRARLTPWAEAFRAWACVSFARTYLRGIAGAAYCPSSAEVATLLLEFYELEKALYEIEYELNNRPHWLAVPLAGLARIADARGQH